MLTWFQTVAELCGGERGWVEVAELPAEWYSPGARGRLRAALSLFRSVICICHPLPTPLPLCVKRLWMEDAAHQKGLLFHRGKTSFENS